MEKQLRNAITMAVALGLTTFVGLIIPATAHAEGTPSDSASVLENVKVLAGLSMGSGSYNNSVGTKMAWGVNLAGRLNETYELGLSYRTSKIASDGESSLSESISYILGELDYRHKLGSGYLVGGLQAGTAKVSIDYDMGLVSLEAASVTKFAIGPKIGYQIPVSEHFEVGATADYLVAFTESKIRSFGVLASAAYSF